MKHTLRIVGAITIAYSMMAGFGYAAGDSDAVSNVATGLYYVVSLLSWLWILLASIAGKLMTNDMVFGGFMHMDSYLLKIHMIVRTVANYGLGFGFIALIGRQLFAADVDIGSIAKKIGGFILAGLLINVSFFAVQVLVDISTIATIAAGNMSQSFLGHNSSQATDVISGMKNHTRSIYKADGTTEYATVEPDSDVDIKSILDTITPNDKSVAGPLVYLGSSILGMQRYSLLQQEAHDKQKFNRMIAGKNLAIGFLVQVVIIGVFSLALVILVVANVVRIGMVWIMAALGPLLFLIRGLQRGGVKVPSAISDIVSDKFSIGSFVKLIFLPVFSVFMLGVTIILTSTMTSVLSTGGTKKTVDLDDNRMSIDNIIETTYNGNFLSDSKDVFSDIIVTIFTLFLLWFVALASVPSSTPIVGGIAKNLTDIAKKGLLSAQFINIPGMPAGTSIGGLAKSFTRRDGALNPLHYGRKLNTQRNIKSDKSAQQLVNKLTGNKNLRLTGTEISEALKNLNDSGPDNTKLTKMFGALKSGLSDLGANATFAMNSISDEKLLEIGKMFVSHQSKTIYSRGRSSNTNLKNAEKPNMFFQNKQDIAKFITLFAQEIGMKPPSTTPGTLDELKSVVLKK